MTYLRTYNIFISHCWSYDSDYIRLGSLLSKAPFFNWKNYSVSKDDSLVGGSKVKPSEEISAFGVVLDRKTAQNLQDFRHVFSHNESRLLTDKLGREDYSKFQFTLHPVFCESFHLDTNKNPELVLPLDWNYLYKNERLRMIVSL